MAYGATHNILTGEAITNDTPLISDPIGHSSAEKATLSVAVVKTEDAGDLTVTLKGSQDGLNYSTVATRTVTGSLVFDLYTHNTYRFLQAEIQAATADEGNYWTVTATLQQLYYTRTGYKSNRPHGFLTVGQSDSDFTDVDAATAEALAQGATESNRFTLFCYGGVSRTYTTDPAVNVVFLEDLGNPTGVTPVVLPLTTVAPGATYNPLGDGMTIKAACTVASLQAYTPNVEAGEDVSVTLYKNGDVASTVTLSGGPEEAGPSGGENTPGTVYAAGDTLNVAFVNSGSVSTGIMAVMVLGP